MGFKRFMFGGGSRPGPSGVEQGLKEQQMYGYGNYWNAPSTGMSKDKTPTFDWSKSDIGKSPSVAMANQGFDYSGMDEAMAGFRKPSLMSFQNRPENYYKNALGMATQDADRDFRSDLFSSNQAVGSMRPGLSAKLAAKLAQAHMQANANTAMGLGQKRMELENQNAIDEQKANADNAYRYLEGLGRTGEAKVAQQGQNWAEKIREFLAMMGAGANEYASQYTSRRGMPNTRTGGFLDPGGQILKQGFA